jgi:hypothetical protein
MLFGQTKMNKVRVSYGCNLLFPDGLVTYRQHPLAYILPNIQYQRQFKANRNYGLLLLMNYAQKSKNADTGPFPRFENHFSTLYGLGMTYTVALPTIHLDFATGLLARAGEEAYIVDDHPVFPLYSYAKNLKSYGAFAQCAIEYKVSKSVGLLGICRYNFLLKNRQHSLSFDLGLTKSF